MRVAFHPHTATWVESPDEVEALASRLPDTGAGLCLDVGHYLVGGGAPVRAIRRYGSLVTHVHLKDVDPAVLARLRSREIDGFSAAVRERIFTELGNGALDLRGVLATLDAVDYDGWLMVEQDSSWLRTRRGGRGRRARAPLRDERAGPMKVAVIGAGSMGGMHADLLGAMDEVDGLFVVDADGDRAEEVAQRAGGRAATFEEAVEEAEAIIIATPPELHRAAVETALDAGRHVLCEKPLTESLSTTIELTRRVEERGSHLEVGFQRRHDPGFIAARDAAEGRIHLRSISPLTIRSSRHSPPVPDRRRRSLRSSATRRSMTSTSPAG